MICPKCQGTAHNILPVAEHKLKIYGCPACGFTFNQDGTPVIMDASKLKDTFQGATLGEALFKNTKETLNPAAKAMFEAKLLEYGLQMWFDGLKQGLLLGAIHETKSRVFTGK